MNRGSTKRKKKSFIFNTLILIFRHTITSLYYIGYFDIEMSKSTSKIRNVNVKIKKCQSEDQEISMLMSKTRKINVKVKTNKCQSQDQEMSKSRPRNVKIKTKKCQCQ